MNACQTRGSPNRRANNDNTRRTIRGSSASHYSPLQLSFTCFSEVLGYRPPCSHGSLRPAVVLVGIWTSAWAGVHIIMQSSVRPPGYVLRSVCVCVWVGGGGGADLRDVCVCVCAIYVLPFGFLWFQLFVVSVTVTDIFIFCLVSQPGHAAGLHLNCQCTACRALFSLYQRFVLYKSLVEPSDHLTSTD